MLKPTVRRDDSVVHAQGGHECGVVHVVIQGYEGGGGAVAPARGAGGEQPHGGGGDDGVLGRRGAQRRVAE